MTITITEDAAKALVRSAQAQRRAPRAQAAVLLTQALVDRSLLDNDGLFSEAVEVGLGVRAPRIAR
jgi:hypothetical protein